MTEDVKQVLAAIAGNDKAERDAWERMDLHRREAIARDLRAGRRVLKWCHCCDCIERALNLQDPDPYRCAGARARAAEERAKAAEQR